jgi:hypothetical protein
LSTAKTIIRRALRLIGELAAGQEPTGSAASDGLERLQSLILDMPGLVQNGFWRETATSTVYAANEGHRVTVTSPGVVTLPLTVSHDGCTRPPHDLAKVQIVGTAANVGLWLYSATKGAWGRADALTIVSELPFGSEDDEGLSAQLAVNMADEYGETVVLGPRTIAKAAISAKSFRARLKKSEARDPHRPDIHHLHHHRDYW